MMRIPAWPVLLVLAGSLLAGCLDDEPVTDDVVVPPAAPPVVRMPVEAQGNAAPGMCNIVCFSGDGQVDVPLGENRTLTGLEIVLSWDEGIREAPEVRLTASCTEGDRACPAGVLASGEGAPPLRLNATELDVPRGAAVRFHVEVLGDMRPDAFFEGYRLQGFLTAIDHAPGTDKTCYADGHDGHDHAETDCPCPAGEDGGPDGRQNTTANGTHDHNGTENGTRNGTAPEDGCESRDEDERDPDVRRRGRGDLLRA